MRISDWSSDVCSSDLLQRLAAETGACGRMLTERLTLYPRYALDLDRWADPVIRPMIRRLSDSHGRARTEGWSAGTSDNPPDARSEERRVGKEGVSTGRTRWSPDTEKKKNK